MSEPFAPSHFGGGMSMPRVAVLDNPSHVVQFVALWQSVDFGAFDERTLASVATVLWNAREKELRELGCVSSTDVANGARILGPCLRQGSEHEQLVVLVPSATCCPKCGCEDLRVQANGLMELRMLMTIPMPVPMKQSAHDHVRAACACAFLHPFEACF